MAKSIPLKLSKVEYGGYDETLKGFLKGLKKAALTEYRIDFLISVSSCYLLNNLGNMELYLLMFTSKNNNCCSTQPVTSSNFRKIDYKLMRNKKKIHLTLTRNFFSEILSFVHYFQTEVIISYLLVTCYRLDYVLGLKRFGITHIRFRFEIH